MFEAVQCSNARKYGSSRGNGEIISFNHNLEEHVLLISNIQFRKNLHSVTHAGFSNHPFVKYFNNIINVLPKNCTCLINSQWNKRNRASKLEKMLNEIEERASQN